jgi:hypothetical protein
MLVATVLLVVSGLQAQHNPGAVPAAGLLRAVSPQLCHAPAEGLLKAALGC